MIPGIDPKIDYAFKRVFGQERNRAVLLHVLNAILQPHDHAPLTDLEFLSPYNDKETSDDKLSVVDVRARDQLGRRFNVEMQMLAPYTFPDRVLYYWSRHHATQLREGQPYEELRPTISVCFLDDILFPTLAAYHSCFRLRDILHPEIVFSPHLEIHLLELPKFELDEKALHAPREQWLYFLRHAARLDTDVLPSTLEVPEIRQAFKELIMVTQSEHDEARYEARFKAEMDARCFKKDIEETVRRKVVQEVRQEVVQEVRQEVRQEGLVNNIQLCQKLLRQPQKSTEELSQLPLEELERLAALLEKQALGGLRPINGTNP